MPETISDVLKSLGRIEAGQEQLRADFDRERVATSDSRRRQYERAELHDTRLTKLESEIRVNSAITLKTQRAVQRITPQVEEATRTLKSWKIKGGVAITGAGMLGAFLWWLLRTNWTTIWAFITSRT